MSWEKDLARDLINKRAGTVFTTSSDLQLHLPGAEGWDAFREIMKYHADKFAADEDLFIFFARNWLRRRGYKVDIRISPSVRGINKLRAKIVMHLTRKLWRWNGMEGFDRLKERNGKN